MNNIRRSGHKLLEEYPTYTRISWNLLEKCNYNCWYCYLGERKREHLITEKELDNLINNIYLNFNDREYIKYIFTGGEPTYYDKKLFYFINRFLNIHNTREIIIHTNLSKSVEWWKEFADNFKGRGVEINASCHLEYVNNVNKESIDDFIYKLKVLQDNDINVFSWVMISDKNKDLALEIRDRINSILPGKANFKFIQHPTTLKFYEKNKQSVNKDKKNVLIEYKNNKKLYLNADELMLQNYNKFKGMICTRGINQLTIDAYGAIYTSECQWVKDKNPEIPAPGFYAPNVILDIKPTICPRKSCDHPSDIYIPKYEMIEYMKLKRGT